VNTTLLHLLPRDSDIVMMNDVYGGTYRFFRQCAVPLGFSVRDLEVVHADDAALLAAIDAAVTPHTSLLWLESPSNPTLRLCPIAAVVARTRQRNPSVLCVVDNTFLTPCYQRPLDLGADFVVHSATKYLNGHSDVVLGIACTKRADLGARLRVLQNSLGTVPDPHACWLASRGLQTLPLRMMRISENAAAIASHLTAPALAPYVRSVIYPGLPQHSGHACLLAQQRLQGIRSIGFSGIIGLFLNTDNPAIVAAFVAACRVFTLAESLGGVESLIEVPARMTHASVHPDHRSALGISEALVRLSVGIEHVDDLVKDLDQALRVAFSNSSL
jgi:cystathionine gamma-lyase